MKHQLGTTPNTPCIEWQKCRHDKGYGLKWVKNKIKYVHRLAWEARRGPIPKGFQVLHSCDNPPCLNIRHLFLGLPKHNTHDMLAKGRGWEQKKTHCPLGHILAGENLRQCDLKRGKRLCRLCHNARQVKYNHAKRRKA